MTSPLVIIPTYNERENVRVLVGRILALPQGFRVLVVDDASPDGTGAVADALARESDRVHVLHRAGKQGIGPAYVAGMKWALAQGADRILQMDCDLSHDPADLPRLLEASRDADVVIGSRYVGGVRVLNWSVKRLMLSLGASFYVRAVLGLPLHDPTGGFKCLRRRVLDGINLERLESRGYSFQIEINYRAWRKGFKLVEIPIVFSERVRGGSKISGSIVYEALYVLLRLRAQLGFSRRPSLATPVEPLHVEADGTGPAR